MQIESSKRSNGHRLYHSHIGFLTLTLPSDQIHSDNEIKRKCLMPFIQQIKRVYGVKENFWSAEPQESGNIHFHLLIDRWVNRDGVNDLWNIATNHLGYLDRYVAKTGDLRPPSTQIRTCPKNMSLVKYVLKYVSKQPEIRCSLRLEDGKKIKRVSFWEKEEIKGGVIAARARGLDLSSDLVTIKGSKVYRWYERRPIEGRSWGMSDGIRKLDVYTAYVSYRVRDLIKILEWHPSVKFVKRDHSEVYYCNLYDVLLKYDSVLLADYRRYYMSVYSDLYRTPDGKQQGSAKVIELNPTVEKVDRPSYKQALLFAG